MPGQGRLGDKAQVVGDAHGCPACPHVAIGPGIVGSPDVNVNKMPALRVGDAGIHAACCGTNTWTADTGAPTVFINGKKAFRLGDTSKHCGASGKLVEGSPNVMVGNETASGSPSIGPSASQRASSASGGGGGGGGGGGSPSSSPGARPDSPPAADDEDRPTVFVMSRRLVGIGGTPLAEHQVELVDPATGERTHGPFTTDIDGHLFVELPDDRAHHLRVIDDTEHDDGPPFYAMVPEDEAVLTIALVDLDGRPLANRRWRATRNGHSFSGTTGDDGAIARSGITPGVYAIEIGDRTYQVHTLHRSDLHDDDVAASKLIVR